MRGWRLEVRATPASSLASGLRGARSQVAARAIPRLAPGRSRTVTLTATAPAEPGDWVMLVDAIDASGARASRAGSPVLEIPLAVVAAPMASPFPSTVQPASPAISQSPR